MTTVLEAERSLGMGAVFSPDRRYRYALYRTWDVSRPPTLWVLLNPSTADETRDDPTIRRCIGFSRRWGDGGVVIVNIFAMRSTDPFALRLVQDPTGRPENDAYIASARVRSARVVAGWGAIQRLGKDLAIRELEVLAKGILGHPDRIMCLGKTKRGDPRHPLYVRGDTPLVPYLKEDA